MVAGIRFGLRRAGKVSGVNVFLRDVKLFEFAGRWYKSGTPAQKRFDGVRRVRLSEPGF